MNKKIFVSHAHKDNEAARELVSKLSDKGVETWFDEYEIKPGDSWENQIKRALVESEAVIVILGEGYASPNVLVEAGMALGQGKTIFPVVVGKNESADIFSSLQRVDASGENGIEMAASQIAGFINKKDTIL